MSAHSLTAPFAEMFFHHVASHTFLVDPHFTVVLSYSSLLKFYHGKTTCTCHFKPDCGFHHPTPIALLDFFSIPFMSIFSTLFLYTSYDIDYCMKGTMLCVVQLLYGQETIFMLGQNVDAL